MVIGRAARADRRRGLTSGAGWPDSSMQYPRRHSFCIDYLRHFPQARTYCIDFDVFQAMRACSSKMSWILHAVFKLARILHQSRAPPT